MNLSPEDQMLLMRIMSGVGQLQAPNPTADALYPQPGMLPPQQMMPTRMWSQGTGEIYPVPAGTPTPSLVRPGGHNGHIRAFEMPQMREPVNPGRPPLSAEMREPVNPPPIDRFAAAPPAADETGAIAPAAPQNMLQAAPAPHRMYDPAAGTNEPRFITPQRPIQAGPVPYAPLGAPGAPLPSAGAPAQGGGGLSSIFPDRQEFVSRLGDFFDGLAMGGGGTWQDSLASAGKMVAAGKLTRKDEKALAKSVNRTVEWAIGQGVDPAVAQAYADAKDSKGLIAYVQKSSAPLSPADRFKSVGGQIYDVQNGSWITPPGGGDQYRMMSPDEVRSAGLDASKSYQVSPKGQITAVGGGGVNVTIGGEDKFQGKNAENMANRFDALATDGQNARVAGSQLGILRQNISSLPGGFLGGAQAIANQWGLKLGENASSIEAARAIINQLVPSQRAPGSGTMSDRDVSLFLDSLPKLSNTPDGNALILDTMQSMADYRVAVGDIAASVQMGELDRAEGLRQIRALPDPMARFNASQSRGGAPGNRQTPPLSTPRGNTPSREDIDAELRRRGVL